MNQWIAFLRAINVGGHNVKMEELKNIFAKMGFAKTGTFIASGNVFFESKTADAADLEIKIEKHLKAALGYEVAAFLRSVPEVCGIAKRESGLAAKALWEVHALNVGFLKEPLGRDKTESLKSLSTEIDAFETKGSELYWLCRKKQSESKCSNALLERKLKVKLTFRGMGTVVKLARLLEG